jgi:DNA replication protein DnaC
VCWLEKIKAKKLSIISKRFVSATFENFRNRPKEIDKISKSYLFYGMFGKGKTHLLYAQYRAITEAGYFHTKFIREVDLIIDMQRQAYEREYTPKLSLETLKQKSDFHLFIDDLGKTPLSEDRTYQLFNLLDLIYTNNFKLSITTNFGMDALESRFDQEIAGGVVRRIQEICCPVYFK